MRVTPAILYNAIGQQPFYKVLSKQTDNKKLQLHIKNAYPLASAQTAIIAPYFQDTTDERTAYNVWKFVKDNIAYVVDSSLKQRIKLPSGVLASRVTDCKSFSLFITTLLNHLGMPAAVRHVSYDVNEKRPGHVYTYYYDRQKKSAFHWMQRIHNLTAKNLTPINMTSIWKQF